MYTHLCQCLVLRLQSFKRLAHHPGKCIVPTADSLATAWLRWPLRFLLPEVCMHALYDLKELNVDIACAVWDPRSSPPLPWPSIVVALLLFRIWFSSGVAAHDVGLGIGGFSFAFRLVFHENVVVAVESQEICSSPSGALRGTRGDEYLAGIFRFKFASRGRRVVIPLS